MLHSSFNVTFNNKHFDLWKFYLFQSIYFIYLSDTQIADFFIFFLNGKSCSMLINLNKHYRRSRKKKSFFFFFLLLISFFVFVFAIYTVTFDIVLCSKLPLQEFKAYFSYNKLDTVFYVSSITTCHHVHQQPICILLLMIRSAYRNYWFWSRDDSLGFFNS